MSCAQVSLLVPVCYLLFWVLLLGFSLHSEPVVCGVGLVIMLTGVPVYFLGVHWRDKPKCIYNFIGKFNIIKCFWFSTLFSLNSTLPKIYILKSRLNHKHLEIITFVHICLEIDLHILKLHQCGWNMCSTAFPKLGTPVANIVLLFKGHISTPTGLCITIQSKLWSKYPTCEKGFS